MLMSWTRQSGPHNGCRLKTSNSLMVREWRKARREVQLGGSGRERVGSGIQDGEIYHIDAVDHEDILNHVFHGVACYFLL